MGLLKITVDRQSKSLVAAVGRSSSFPPLYQTNQQDFQIQVTDPAVDFGDSPTVLDCSAFTFRAVLFIVATGTEGDEAENLLAATYQGGWTWDPVLMAFTGTMDLHTAEIAAFLADKDVASASIEFNLIKATGRAETILKAAISLRANGDIGGSIAPSLLTAPPTIFARTIAAAAGVVITDNIVTFSGLAFGYTPSYFLPFMQVPAGSGTIEAQFIRGSGTSDGCAFILSAIPENPNYLLAVVLVP